jgi:hypothetical protein
VHVRIEDPLRHDLLHALRDEGIGKRRARHLDALDDLGLLVVLCGIERALEVVEHGQQLGDEPLGCTRREGLLVADGPLAVVVEVRREPLQGREILVPLALDRRENSLGRFRLGRRLGRRGGSLVPLTSVALGVAPRLGDGVGVELVAHALVAVSSSMTSKSASSTTSSSSGAASPFPAAPVSPLAEGPA